MTLIRICAWCGKFIGVKTATAGDGVEITHGMCPRCREEQKANARTKVTIGESFK